MDEPLHRIISQSPDLRARFEARKHELIAQMAAFAPQHHFDEAKVSELLRAVHKLAGVAGLFGAARLAELAACGEVALRAAAPPDRPALLASLREAVEREAHAD